MDFKDTQAIYIQIADFVCDNIVTGKWEGDGRIPSVRELGMQLEVNPNTVMRAYEWLQNRQIIYNKRGIGYFVFGDAREQILSEQRAAFLEKELPELYRRMRLLGISVQEIVAGLEACSKKEERKDKEISSV